LIELERHRSSLVNVDVDLARNVSDRFNCKLSGKQRCAQQISAQGVPMLNASAT
jgi:hypothetical protein